MNSREGSLKEMKQFKLENRILNSVGLVLRVNCPKRIPRKVKKQIKNMGHRLNIDSVLDYLEYPVYDTGEENE